MKTITMQNLLIACVASLGVIALSDVNPAHAQFGGLAGAAGGAGGFDFGDEFGRALQDEINRRQPNDGRFRNGRTAQPPRRVAQNPNVHQPRNWPTQWFPVRPSDIGGLFPPNWNDASRSVGPLLPGTRSEGLPEFDGRDNWVPVPPSDIGSLFPPGWGDASSSVGPPPSTGSGPFEWLPSQDGSVVLWLPSR